MSTLSYSEFSASLFSLQETTLGPSESSFYYTTSIHTAGSSILCIVCEWNVHSMEKNKPTCSPNIAIDNDSCTYCNSDIFWWLVTYNLFILFRHIRLSSSFIIWTFQILGIKEGILLFCWGFFVCFLFVFWFGGFFVAN